MRKVATTAQTIKITVKTQQKKKKLLKPVGVNWFSTITFLLMKMVNTESIRVKKRCVSILPFNSRDSYVLHQEGAWGWREAQLIRTDWPHTEVIAVTLVLWAQAENSHLAHLRSTSASARRELCNGSQDFTWNYILFLFRLFTTQKPGMLSSCSYDTHLPFSTLGGLFIIIFLMRRHVE